MRSLVGTDGQIFSFLDLPCRVPHFSLVLREVGTLLLQQSFVFPRFAKDAKHGVPSSLLL